MALVTRQEFADLCGKPVAIINTNVVRKKIQSLKDKRIDTENPLNKIFQKKCKQEAAGMLKEKRQAKKAEKEKPISEIYKETVEIFSPVETPEERKERLKANRDLEEKLEGENSWDLRKKIADALKAEQLAEKERLNVEKLMGQLIPVDLHKAIFKVNIQDILMSFTAESVNLASIYCDILAGGDRDKLAEVTQKIQYAINTIVKRVEQTAAKEVENVIEEYAETRSRGEKR